MEGTEMLENSRMGSVGASLDLFTLKLLYVSLFRVMIII